MESSSEGDIDSMLSGAEASWGVREGDLLVRSGGSIVSAHAVVDIVDALLPIASSASSHNHTEPASSEHRSTDANAYDNVDVLTYGCSETCSITFVHDDIFPARKRRLNELTSLVRNVQARLGDDTDVASRMNDDDKARITRLVEILYYAETMQLARRHLMTLLSSGVAGVRNVPNAERPMMVFGRRFRREEDETKHTPLQLLFITMLEKLAILGWRRYDSCCYEPIRIENKYCHAWKQVCTVEEFVWREISTHMHADNWLNATMGKGNVDSTVTYLLKCHQPEFPDLVKNRRIHAFRNAVYITSVRTPDGKYVPESHVWYVNEPETEILSRMTRGGEVAAVFHDCNFPARDPVTGKPRVYTPSLNRVIDHQCFPEDVAWWLRAFIGRVLHPIGSEDRLDTWQVIGFLLGLGNTGKSTLISDVMFYFFAANDVTYIANNIEKQFGWSACENKFLWLAPEVKGDFADHTDQATWQQVVCGERLSCARKYAVSPVQFTPFDVPGFMAGNETINFSDNSGSVSRRRVDWYFGNPVRETDPELPGKLRDEIGHIIFATNEVYLEATSKVRSRIWNYLPEYFHAMRAENAAQTNALTHMLQNAPLEFGSALYMHFSEFQRLYKQHCKDNDFNARSLRKDYFGGPFKENNIEMVRGLKPDPFDVATERQGPWVVGCVIRS